MLFEIHAADDHHADELEWERRAAEQLGPAHIDDLGPDWFSRDHGVHVATEKGGAMAIGRQIHDLEIVDAESRCSQRPPQQIRADRVDLHRHAAAWQVGQRRDIRVRDHGISAARLRGHEQNDRIHAALREGQHFVHGDERGLDAAIPERAHHFPVVDELDETEFRRREPAAILREENDLVARSGKGPDSDRRYGLATTRRQPDRAHRRDRHSVPAGHRRKVRGAAP